MNQRSQQKLRISLGYGLGGLFCFALILPLIWVVTTSVRPLAEMTRTPPLVFPRSITFSAYFEMWDTGPFVKYFMNHLLCSGNIV